MTSPLDSVGEGVLQCLTIVIPYSIAYPLLARRSPRVSLFVLMLFLALWLGVPQSTEAQTPGRYHRVAKGETLDSIARKYRVPVYNIARANRIQVNSSIASGSHLFIPGVTAAPAPSRTLSRSSATSNARPQTTNRRPEVTIPNTATTTTRRPAASASAASGTVTVKSGDSLWGIANRNGLTVKELAALNGISENAGLKVGQKLRLSSGGSIDEAPSRETAIVEEQDTQEPEPRLATSSTRTGSPTGAVGSTFTPGPPKSRTGSGVSSSGYQWPVQGSVLRTYENKSDSKHFGLDIEVPKGTPVKAAKGGKVVFTGRIPAYGNMVIVTHDSQYATCYAFCETILVKENQQVSRGETIARSGDPGKSNSPYLHFQIRKNGEAINPRPLLP
ncbi:MAG: peptidoglycan DD-metalloendopeptidase family protein [Candidatus Sumerlaeia bacterium]|nr:peptidoglycan DD-metalloendopeptidase family protein [Candidatus Sumerlaeia bacterium]